MEIREVPAGKSCSHRSHSSSSSSRGSVKGAAGVKKVKNRSKDEQRAPEHHPGVSPERPPRPFLKTSFGQRLTAQCGSILFDSASFSHQAGCARATPVSGTTTNKNQDHGGAGQTLEGGGSPLGGGGDRTKLRLTGNSHSASGRGSSGLSEVDVKGQALVTTQIGSSSEQLKLWGFPPGTIPKQRAMAMVGQASSKVAADSFSFDRRDHSSRRDASPLGHAQRAAAGNSIPPRGDENQLDKETKDETLLQLVPPKLELDGTKEKKKQQSASELELEEARKEMILMAAGNKSLSLPLVKAEADDQMIVPANENGGMLPTDHPREPATNLSDLGAPQTSKPRPSFKNDCGFLKLLPSKRKFSLEEQDQASPLQKPAGYMLYGESENAGLRLSSTSSSGIQGVTRKSLLLHLADKPKSVTNDITRDNSNSKERRTLCSDQFAAPRPVVGSFMKWMIDVGKGLTKKRCFGSEATAAQSSELSPLGSPGGGPCSSADLRIDSSSNAKVLSSTAMKQGRAISPQSMDCTDDGGGGSAAAAAVGRNEKDLSEMHTSGDEQQKSDPQPRDSSPEDHRAQDEGGNSTNATEGTTRSSGPRNAKTIKEDVSKTEEQLRKQEQHPDRGQALQDHQAHASSRQQQPQQQPDKHEVIKQEQQPEVSKSKSGGGEEASFGMWQAASCLIPSSTQPEKASRLLRSSTGTRSKARHLAAALDASGDLESSQGMAEFVASMASVKSWVSSSYKVREKLAMTTTTATTSSNKPCSFCGLRGHSVRECSETLECELKELERRAMVLEDMSSEVRDLPCLRCLGMAHLGAQCRFSVTEAASRARENSEMRNWRFMRRNVNSSSTSNVAAANTTATNIPKTSSTNLTLADGISPVVDNGIPSTSTAALPHSGQFSVRNPSKDHGRNEQTPKDNITLKKIGLQKPAAAATAAAPAAQPCKKAAPQSSDTAPCPPKDMLAAIESVRLSRSELWRWVETPDFSTNVRGFFLRLRFGRWEKDLGGTGYRMARIRGAIRKIGDDKNMSVSVDLGDMECTVDSQYVSNHSFTEAELVEWWRGRWKAGKRLIGEAELQTKLAQRHNR